MLLASLLTFIGFALIRVWPFGDGTVLIIDSLHQYLPFYTDFHEKLIHGDSLLYSFSGGLGYDFWATWAYYMASPFNFLIALVPTPNVGDFMDLMILLKIGLCGGTFSWYLHKRNPARPFMPIVFGCMFALGNFMMGYYFNLMWLDSIAMTPLIMYGIEQIVKGKKGLFYGLSLFYGLWCNYYVGFMLCIFSCLYLALCVIESRRRTGKEYVRIALRFGWHSLLAGGMASVVLLPAYRALTVSESMLDNSFPTTIRFYTDFLEMITAHFAAEHPINISDSQVGLNAYCGVIVLILILCYILDDRIRLRVRIARTCMLGLFLLSFSMNILNYVWHGFHQQNGLPNRFAFLYVFLLLTACYDAYGDIPYLSSLKLTLAGAIPFLVSLFAVASGKTDFEEYGYWNYLTPVLILLYLGIIVFFRTPVLFRKAGAVVLGSVMLLEAAAHCIYGTQYNENVTRSIYLKDQASYRQLVGEQQDTDFFRSEIDSQRMRNVTMFAGGHSMIMFNSTMQASVTEFCDRLGIEARTNKNGYIGVTRLLNDVFGIRYVLSSNGKGDALYQFEKIGEDDNLAIYYNPDALSLGFLVNEEIRLWNTQEGDPLEVQNAFVRLATGQDEIYTLDRKVDAEDDKPYGVKIPEGKQVYLYLPEKIESITVDTPEYKKTYSTYTDHLYVVNGLDDDRMGEFTCQLKSSQSRETVWIYTCPDELVKKVRDALAVSQLEDVDAAGNHLRGTIDADRDGILLLTIPYSHNWSVRVDGETVKAEPIGGALMGIPVTKGNHSIRMSYIPNGLKSGLCLSVLCTLLLILTMIVEKKRKPEKHHMQLYFSDRAVNGGPGVRNTLDEIMEKCAAGSRQVFDLSDRTWVVPDTSDSQETALRPDRHPAGVRYTMKEIPGLLAEAEAFYQRHFGITVKENEIMLTADVGEGTELLIRALCNPGDLVLTPDPGCPAFAEAARQQGASVWEYPAREENGYLPVPEHIPEEVLGLAKLIIVSGLTAAASEESSDTRYQELISFANEHDLVIVHVNTGGGILFGDGKEKSFLSYEGAGEVGAELYAIPGDISDNDPEMCMLTGNPQLIGMLKAVRAHLDVEISCPMQYRAAAALGQTEQALAERSAEYEKRMQTLCRGLREIGWNVPDSRGTAFVWAPLPDGFTDSKVFCLELAERAGVFCTPGSSFGSLGEGTVRFALSLPEDELYRAVRAVDECGILKETDGE